MRLDVHISLQALNGLKALKGVGEEFQEEAPTIVFVFSDLKFEGFNLMFRVKNHQGHLFRVKQSDTAKSEKKLHNKIAVAVDRILIHIIYTFTFREGSAFVTS